MSGSGTADNRNSTTNLGYRCGCDTGYQLAPNNHDCIGMHVTVMLLIITSESTDILDIKNCLINDHNCSQVCVELEGSFSCSCYSGYRLQEDKATCAGSYKYIKLKSL